MPRIISITKHAKNNRSGYSLTLRYKSDKDIECVQTWKFSAKFKSKFIADKAWEVMQGITPLEQFFVMANKFGEKFI